VKAEIQRRESLTDHLEAYVTSRPGQWLTMSELAHVGGLGGWRTRLSDLRLKRGLTIEWNGKNGSASRHRYVPQAPIGRAAEDQIEGTGLLFDLSPRG